MFDVDSVAPPMSFVFWGLVSLGFTLQPAWRWFLLVMGISLIAGGACELGSLRPRQTCAWALAAYVAIAGIVLLILAVVVWPVDLALLILGAVCLGAGCFVLGAHYCILVAPFPANPQEA